MTPPQLRPLSAAATAEHSARRERIKTRLPAIAQRVFALRAQSYAWRDSQHRLETEFGHLVCVCNENSQPLDETEARLDQVVAQRFLRNLIRAELSMRGLEPRFGAPGVTELKA